ncbi:MAG: iron-containing redox enzyme family protein [Acidiferrobacteraceae bacterium]
MPRTIEVSESTYETVDTHEIERLRHEHAWITEPLYRASDQVREMPFFDWLDSLKSPQEFQPAAVQLFHHSATFPKVMGLMLATTPMSENHMMPFYATHAYGEATHHELLMQWMLRHRLLPDRSAIASVIPTLATNACINLAYQMALEGDRYKWILTINSGIERCSNDFFKIAAPKMRTLGAGDTYFDIHVEADEHHSIMGMAHLEPQDQDSVRGRQLIAKALEGVALWAAMIHSWIGLDVLPSFELDGTLARSQRQAA